MDEHKDGYVPDVGSVHHTRPDILPRVVYVETEQPKPGMFASWANVACAMLGWAFFVFCSVAAIRLLYVWFVK